MSELLVGVAGWSYPDWRGVVYPKGCKDELAFLARYVDLIEVNSTFYRVPVAEHAASWLRRTESRGTWFTAKVPRDVTHEGRADEALLAEIRAGFAPLVDSGRLLTLLLQFDYRFEAGVGTFGWLGRVADGLAGAVPLTLEVRHKSWNESGNLERVADLGFGVANLDYPGASSGFGVDATACPASGVAYYRLHGRNRAWFDKKAGRDETYDHEYTADEVAAVVERIERIASGAPKTVVVGNNHFQGKALKLALQLKAWREGGRVSMPEGLVAAYPDLGDVAVRTTLF